MSAPANLGRIDGLIARLQARHPRLIDLSLGRMQRVLAALGHPDRRLPPVLHVAGTNGKGSVCAFMRSIGEAAGLRVHVFISPHLVRFNERIRLAGTLVSDAAMEEAIATVERVNGDAPLSVFETIQAAAFLLFAETPADLCVLEVGLGGRWDATNVIEHPAACAITSISMDHRDFLGDTLTQIAGEKAGIIKPGIPVATGIQQAEALAVIEAEAAAQSARLLRRDHEWTIAPTADGLVWHDPETTLNLPFPSLPGAHQHDNAGIAVAAIRAARLGIGDNAIAAGIARTVWPARMQRLHGALAKTLPPDWELWLDGGHNEGGGAAIGAHLATWADRPTHVVIGMKKSKDSAGFLAPILPHAKTLWAVVEPGQHLAMPIEDIVAASAGRARPGPTIAEALAALLGEEGPREQGPRGQPARVLICGSLYLAGEVLKADGTIPE
jgi:dihydrofolate synthase/folylpolyglutamate synthase